MRGVIVNAGNANWRAGDRAMRESGLHGRCAHNSGELIWLLQALFGCAVPI